MLLLVTQFSLAMLQNIYIYVCLLLISMFAGLSLLPHNFGKGGSIICARLSKAIPTQPHETLIGRCAFGHGLKHLTSVMAFLVHDLILTFSVKDVFVHDAMHTL